MTRHVRIYFVLIALLWQSMGMLTPAFAQETSAQTVHLLAHDKDVGHHHHDDDQSLHMDDSGGHVVHQHAESGSTTVGLFLYSLGKISVIPASAPTVAKYLPHTPPFLDGLLRPPQPLA